MHTIHLVRWRIGLAVSLALLLVCSIAVGTAATKPQGQMTWALHFTTAPTYFDPAETPGIITPFLFLYAMHDALVKPMPGNPQAPSLAESWSESADGLTYEFKLRKGVTFHNGDPFTAEDVKFSLERYRGASANLYKEKVKAVEIVDPHLVRIHLKEPWPDFMTFYGTPLHRCRVDCTQEVCRAGRRRWLQAASHRRRSL
jgi:peptide/nickel transport system substrate-binding protein